jgi:hypothetical protein
MRHLVCVDDECYYPTLHGCDFSTLYSALRGGQCTLTGELYSQAVDALILLDEDVITPMAVLAVNKMLLCAPWVTRPHVLYWKSRFMPQRCDSVLLRRLISITGEQEEYIINDGGYDCNAEKFTINMSGYRYGQLYL